MLDVPVLVYIISHFHTLVQKICASVTSPKVEIVTSPSCRHQPKTCGWNNRLFEASVDDVVVGGSNTEAQPTGHEEGNQVLVDSHYSKHYGKCK